MAQIPNTAIITDLLSTYLDSKAQERRYYGRLAQRKAIEEERNKIPKRYSYGGRVVEEDPNSPGGFKDVFNFEQPQDTDKTIISKYIEGLAQTPGLTQTQQLNIGEILNKLEILPDETPSTLLRGDINRAESIISPPKKAKSTKLTSRQKYLQKKNEYVEKEYGMTLEEFLNQPEEWHKENSIYTPTLRKKIRDQLGEELKVKENKMLLFQQKKIKENPNITEDELIKLMQAEGF